MVPNPYAPPRSGNEPRVPRASEVRLFGATAIVLHALLFPAPVGALLAAENYRRLRDASGFRRALLFYVLPSTALLFFTIAAANPPQKLLALVAQLGVTIAMFRDQRPVVQRHLEAGGRWARWYLATLLSLLVLIILLAVLQILDPSSPRAGA
jgi:hypothetical protein